MHVIRHLRIGVDRDAVLNAALPEATQEEAVFPRIRKQSSTIVASEDQVVWVIGEHGSGSRLARHVRVFGSLAVQLRVFAVWVATAR